MGTAQSSKGGTIGRGRLGRLARLAVAASTLSLGCALWATADPAIAQTAVSLVDLPAVDEDEQMLVEANELIYDNANQVVTAQGDVQIYYGPYTLQADQVIYDQRSQRLRAVGRVRVTEPDGNVIYADLADLSDDFREGFVESLTVETPENTTISAANAERVADNTTIFNRGVYTACEACEDDPSRPPLWQVKAVRIVHDQQKKTIYYRNASLEFFGFPVAFFPFFSTPDPTVKRKTGFLSPGFRASNTIGYGLEIPYFINIAPNKDVTLRPLVTTRQGVLARGEWRHRTVNGRYVVDAAGIRQLNPDTISPDNPGDDREWRGFVSTRGDFAINRDWSYGWDATIVSDDGFLDSYSINSDTWLTSTAYLIGQSERNRFETRAYVFRRQRIFDYDQSALPVVLPSVDYNYLFDRDVLGGELGFDVSAYNTHRGDIDDATLVALQTAGTLAEDDYSHSSRIVAEVHWRRQMIDSLGQVFAPFASVRGDIYRTEAGYNAGRQFYSAAWLPAEYDDWQPRTYDDETTARVIPTVGMEYRYPFVSRREMVTQVFEPVAQIYYRPNLHSDQNDILNEDALSVVFDSTSLFDRDKFSGYDRVETGLRANVGVRYTATFANDFAARVTFGRSFQIAGDNPFPEDSGLEEHASDYVGAAALDLGRYFQVAASTRFDADTFEIKRNDVVGSANVGRMAASLTYAHIEAQPALGSRDDSRQIISSAGFRLTQNWSVSGYSRYDFEESEFNSSGFGISYGNECFTLSLSYNENYKANEQIDRTIGVSFNLRTLGGVSASSGQLDVFGTAQ